MLYLVDMLVMDPNILRDSILVLYSLPLCCDLPKPSPATNPATSTCITVASCSSVCPSDVLEFV
jgi:hypothetical protein